MTDGGSMSAGSLLANLEKIGFQRVTFRDGYDYGVYYDLDPGDEANGGASALAGLGLSQPLVLK
jgi:hypothetical protein